MDGAHALVRFPPKDAAAAEHAAGSDLASLLQDCRLLRKDELQVVRGSSAPRVPDCFQKTPRRVALGPDVGQILAITADLQGLRLLCRRGQRLAYLAFNLSTGKLDQESPLPTEAPAFLGGRPAGQVSLHGAGESSPVLLRDGNGALYPLARDCTGGIRDPAWLNLSPAQGVGMAIHAVQHSTGGKARIAVIAVALEMQSLLSAIVRTDMEKVKAVLSAVERIRGKYRMFVSS